jgi:hypothetical protein
MTTMTTFDTILGRCGIAWTEAGISRVFLPSSSMAAAQAADVPGFVADAIARIAAMLAGAPDDLADLPLDDARIDDFRRSVYAATRRIGPFPDRLDLAPAIAHDRERHAAQRPPCPQPPGHQHAAAHVLPNLDRPDSFHGSAPTSFDAPPVAGQDVNRPSP